MKYEIEISQVTSSTVENLGDNREIVYQQTVVADDSPDAPSLVERVIKAVNNFQSQK